jgi:hypothetical protein
VGKGQSMIWDRNKLTATLIPLTDDYLRRIKTEWFEKSHPVVTNQQLIPQLNEWFQSTRVNDLQGWASLPCIDITMGNTHYIESFVTRHGWDGFQVLTDEYAYYSFNGKWGVEVGNLELNKPLIITLPHYKWAGVRPQWPDILRECEQKNIDIHIDMAWCTLSKNVAIDFAHPNIQSIGMSISKYSMQWNRIGLRYSKQRTMDSITMFNHYYQPDTNSALSSFKLCRSAISTFFKLTSFPYLVLIVLTESVKANWFCRSTIDCCFRFALSEHCLAENKANIINAPIKI